MNGIEMLAVVALVKDLPEEGLRPGKTNMQTPPATLAQLRRQAPFNA